jgi:ubiquinone/menaquinone biosynthesis C-methylase UbiE
MSPEELRPTNDPATMWARGDYGIIGANLQEVADKLCGQIGIAIGGHVLDVGAGTGNAAVAAARLGHVVAALDVSAGLLDRAKARAQAEDLGIDCVVGSAEALPFADQNFDAVISTFGVMFAPNHEAAAAEMLRVTKPGGTIALANWSPDGVFGESGKTTAEFLPPTNGGPAPAQWGRQEYLHGLFESRVEFECAQDTVLYRYASVEIYLDVLIGTYPPLINTMAKLDTNAQAALHEALRHLYSGYNTAADGTFELPMGYLRAIGPVR